MSAITTDQFNEIVAGLYDCDVLTKEGAASDLEAKTNIVATYCEVDSPAQFVIVCDLPLANSLGAALTKIPPGGAEDATAEGSVPNNIADNLREVLNICSTVFAEHENRRIVLDQVYLPGEEVDADVQGKLGGSTSLLDANCELERYQAGNISLLQLS